MWWILWLPILHSHFYISSLILSGSGNCVMPSFINPFHGFHLQLWERLYQIAKVRLEIGSSIDSLLWTATWVILSTRSHQTEEYHKEHRQSSQSQAVDLSHDACLRQRSHHVSRQGRYLVLPGQIISLLLYLIYKTYSPAAGQSFMNLVQTSYDPCPDHRLLFSDKLLNVICTKTYKSSSCWKSSVIFYVSYSPSSTGKLPQCTLFNFLEIRCPYHITDHHLCLFPPLQYKFAINVLFILQNSGYKFLCFIWIEFFASLYQSALFLLYRVFRNINCIFSYLT